MQAGTANGSFSATLLIRLLTLLLCAGCNLNIAPDDSATRFEGPPVITIAAPQPNQTFLAGTTVIVQARIENAGPDLARVAVLLDESLLGERLQPNETSASVLPLTIDWPTSNAGQFTISVVAERNDGSAAREDVSIEVISRQRPEAIPPTDVVATEAQPTTAPTDEPGPPVRAAPQATVPSAPTNLGPSRVPGAVIRVSNLRPGPGVVSGQPVGSLAADDQVVIVAVNPAGDWFRITYGDSGDAWIYAELVAPTDVTSGLPVETGAPPPLEDGVNLLVTNIELDPATPVCGQATTIRATIRNSGSLDSQTSPWVSAKAHLLSDQSVQAENPETTYLSKLKAGDETVLEMSLTLTANYAQLQQIRITVDAGNHILETNENDNVGRSLEFELSQGNCA